MYNVSPFRVLAGLVSDRVHHWILRLATEAFPSHEGTRQPPHMLHPRFSQGIQF